MRPAPICCHPVNQTIESRAAGLPQVRRLQCVRSATALGAALKRFATSKDVSLKNRTVFSGLAALTFAILWALPQRVVAQTSRPDPVVLSDGWQLQDIAKVSKPGQKVSSLAFKS